MSRPYLAPGDGVNTFSLGGANLGGFAKNIRFNNGYVVGHFTNNSPKGQETSPLLGGNIQYASPYDIAIASYDDKTVTLSVRDKANNTNLRTEDGYGENFVLRDKTKRIAGGGCAVCVPNAYGSYNEFRGENLGIGVTSGDIKSDAGGGASPIVYRGDDEWIPAPNNYRINHYSIVRYPSNGAPNTGAGGSSGVYALRTTHPKGKGDLGIYAPGGRGGSGLCVMELYPDDMRPDYVSFVPGINEFVIE